METSRKSKNSKEIRANFLLLITALIWGGGFVAQRLGIQELGPFIFNGFWFLVVALTLLPVIVIRNKRDPKGESDLKKILINWKSSGIIPVFRSHFSTAWTGIYLCWKSRIRNRIVCHHRAASRDNLGRQGTGPNLGECDFCCNRIAFS